MNWEIDFLNQLANTLKQSQFDWLSQIMRVITFSVDRGIIWILLAAILLIFSKTRKTGVLLAIGLVISLLVNNLILKYAVHRIRPYYTEYAAQVGFVPLAESWFLQPGKGFLGFFELPNETSYSFASGHTFASFVCATIIMFKSKRWGIVALFFAIIVGFSRLYFGVHYPTDVIGGFVLGIIFGLIVAILGNKVLDSLFKKIKKQN